jgi:N5-(cytidine 5'-diphosphoramidyl)-L-glutamine hydrolase
MYRSKPGLQVKIVITQREVENSRYVDHRDALSQDWVVFLEELIPGCVVLPLPNRLSAVRDWLEVVLPDVMLFSNGNDWGASHYRDDNERKVFQWVLAKGVPILGVCRGLQVMNIIGKGKLEGCLDDITDIGHVAESHDVAIEGAIFQEILGKKISVNSYHNQGVVRANLSDDYMPFAVAEDSVIEGFYSNKSPLLAIQWHPEREGANTEFNTRVLKRFFIQGAFWNE